MKYKEMKIIKNIDLLLLHYIGIVTVASKVYKINHFPDFDKTPYGGTSMTQYSFEDYWDFSSKYHSIIRVNFGEVCFLHFDDICRIAEKYKIKYEEKKYDSVAILEKAIGKNKNLFLEEGMNPEFDGFEFHDLTLNYVDNHKKRILFNGGVSAASDTVTDCDWDLYTELQLIGVNKNIKSRPIYMQLIAEGCVLYMAKSFKLAFFIIYSALESYINLKTNGQNEEIRINEKINKAFDQVFSNLSSHNIYSTIMVDLRRFTEMRNTIAHGRKSIKVGLDDCLNIMVFTCTVMSSLENKIDSFDILKKHMQL